MAKQRGKDGEEPAFEEALAKLEGLVSEMEDGTIPLADLVTKFEEGSKLLKVCQKRLGEAELKIEKLKAEGGESATEPFEDVNESESV